jgi:hypothetical protein
MKKAMIFTGEADGSIWQIDVIDYQGEPWLVPMWLQNKDEGWMKPARIIRMRGHRYQEESEEFGYVLNEPLPKAVLEGRQPKGGSFEVIEQPDIRIPTGGIQ